MININRIILTTVIGALAIMAVLLIPAPVMTAGEDDARVEDNSEWIYARLTAYSPKSPKDGNRNHRGKLVKNETGCAIPWDMINTYNLKDGDQLEIEGVGIRTIDDRVPKRAAKKFDYMVVDLRYYHSIRSKPETRAVDRELRRRFDKDYGWVRIIRN